MVKLKAPKPKGSGKLADPLPSSIDHNTRRVVFGFRHITRGYDLGKCAAQHGGNLIDSLRIRCHMTWAELRQQDHRKLGPEKISAALKVAIPQQVPKERHGEMLSVRFGGDMERFIGFQEDATFEVVWIDPTGDCYKH